MMLARGRHVEVKKKVMQLVLKVAAEISLIVVPLCTCSAV